MKTNRKIVEEVLPPDTIIMKYHTDIANAAKLETLAACAWLLDNGSVEAALLEIQRIAHKLESPDK